MFLRHSVSVGFPLVLAIVGLLGVGCGDDESSSDAGGAGGSAAGGQSAGGQSAGGGGAGGGAALLPCAQDITWAEGTTLGDPRDHHATFAMTIGGNSFLYAAGGTDYNSIKSDIWRAPILPGGELGDWVASPNPNPLENRTGQGMAKFGDKVLMIAGRLPVGYRDDVAVAQVQADGFLSDITLTTPLPDSRFHLSATQTATHVYVTGGLQRPGNDASDTVYTGAFDANGGISSWVETKLPSPRSHHTSFVAGDFIYVAGGLFGAPAGTNTWLGDVIRAPLQADGSVGVWEAWGGLPDARVTHASFILGGCVYVLGGLTENPFAHRDDVLAAPFDEDGNLGAWTALASRLPVGRSHLHHVAIVNERAYLVGGAIGQQDVTGASAVGSFVFPQ